MDELTCHPIYPAAHVRNKGWIIWWAGWNSRYVFSLSGEMHSADLPHQDVYTPKVSQLMDVGVLDVGIVIRSILDEEVVLRGVFFVFFDPRF